ncbi:MAG: DUF975 family protein [Bacteroidales bacterium]|nr:DUF975 family protein [Bacteroidales bacterium]
MKTNLDYKYEARKALRGNWGRAVLATIIFFFITCAITTPVIVSSYQMQDKMASMTTTSSALQASDPAVAQQLLETSMEASRAGGMTTLLEILLLLPLTLGFTNAFKELLLEGDPYIFSNTIKIGFRPYWRNIWGMLLMGILTVLWTFLFIIPGIIKAFSYSMTPYILHDNPELSASEAIHRSRMMMRGHKFDLFWLWLSFIGWMFLCILTAGIGFLWLCPYMETAQAAFYQDVKAEYELKGGLD